MEKLVPINHGGKPSLWLGTKSFEICIAFAQCDNTGPAVLHPGLKTWAKPEPISGFKPYFHTKPSTRMLHSHSPSALPKSKAFSIWFISFPKSVFLSSTQPRSLNNSWKAPGIQWAMGRDGWPGMCIPRGLCIHRVLGMTQNLTFGSGHLLLQVVQSRLHPWAGECLYSFTSCW